MTSKVFKVGGGAASPRSPPRRASCKSPSPEPTPQRRLSPSSPRAPGAEPTPRRRASMKSPAPEPMAPKSAPRRLSQPCPGSAAPGTKSAAPLAHTARREVQTLKTLREVSMAVVAVQRLRCPGSGSKAVFGGNRSAPLAAARATYKDHVHAVERSQHFTSSMLQKIDSMCDDLVSCSTSCGTSSPSVGSSMGSNPASPRGSP